MIIVEGVDNSGKTTLIHQIQSAVNLPSEHSPSKLIIDGHIEEWLLWIEWTLVSEAASYIFDRHPIISEPIYGPVLRNINLLSTTDYLERLLKTQPMIIFCDPPKHVILERPKEEMENVQENIPTLIIRYRRFMTLLDKQGFFVLRYDYTKNRPDVIIRQVIRHASEKPPMIMIQGGKS